MSRRCLVVTLALTASLGCGRSGRDAAVTADASAPPAPRVPAARTGPVVAPPVVLRPPADASSPTRTANVPSAGTSVRVPAGSYHVGSTPGDLGRDPAVEVDGLAISVPGYDLDALPYPNDPAQPPQTGVSRDEAARLCAARGRRLCAEVEWERACRGREETVFPGGDTWDPARCAGQDLGACASSYGALSMGARFAEWTLGNIEDRAVIRGASANAAAPLHRCASRRTATATATGLEVGFRCCGGPAPSGEYPREVQRRMYREEQLTAPQVADVIAQVPELERLHLREGLGLFPAGAINEVLNHGATTAELHPEETFTVHALRWSPTFGEELLVLIGRSRPGSWIAALWALPGGRYRHASSFLLRDDAVSLALAYNTGSRREVRWAACWNCGGECGAVVYTEDGRVTIVQR